MKVLFVNACISMNNPSRTKLLCDKYLERLLSDENIQLEQFDVNEKSVQPFTAEKVRKRAELCKSGDFSDDMFLLAKQLLNADRIVIGVPYWDLSFPSLLKIYIENIMVTNLTFHCTERGFSGLCKADKLTYITTAGGFIGNNNFGYDYVRAVANMLGIEDTECIYADGLDIEGMNADEIIKKVIEAM